MDPGTDCIRPVRSFKVTMSMCYVYIVGPTILIWFSCQVQEDVLVVYGKSVVYTIKALQPYTNYCVSLACVGSAGYWSEWSNEVPVMTLERGELALGLGRSR